MPITARGIFLLFVSMLMLSSCINLKSLQDYSKTSVTSLKEFEELDYTFTRHCTDRCLFESVRQNTVLRENECNCDLYDKADTATFTIYNAINAYFIAIGELAGDDATNYTLEPLEKSINEKLIPVGGTTLQIAAEQVTSYSKIASLLLKATTNGYRHKKLKEFIKEGNEPIKSLIAGLQQILTANLAGELTIKKERLYAFYKEIVLDGSSSLYEKRKATREFYEATAEVKNKQQLIKTMVESLQKISEGHEELNRSKLSVKELAKMLSPISSDLKELISEFNKLKNSK